MINRNRTPTQYVFNSKTGMLEKPEDITKIPKKANEKANQTAEPVTSIMVVTSEDNLIHNYFYSYETSWDATNCLQIAIIKMPKMGQENINYWATYTGQLTIYMGYNFTFDKVNNNNFSTEQEAAESLARYWDNSKVKPFFRGEVDRIKEYQNDILIYVKNIGARFQQKMPDEFRQAFVYNQPVRDAFQAMCEFLGVQYICPPQTVTDEAGEETVGGETGNDGTENNVGQQISTANQLANQAKTQVSNSSTNSSTDPNSQDPNDPNATTEEGLETDVKEIINGYDDISFDANGSIVHSSATIETSPDMADTLIAMEEHPFEKYLEDETGIVEKVQNFLDGEMFEELHNNVMDYGAITIEPKAASSSEMSSAAGTTGTTGNSSSGSNSGSDSESDIPRSEAEGSITVGTPQPSARAIADHRASTPTNWWDAIHRTIFGR